MRDAIQEKMVKFYAKSDRNVTVNAATGHFATSQSHVNYYIDVTRLKISVKEANEASKSLCQMMTNTIDRIDTIVCMDDSLTLGAFLASEMERTHYRMMKTGDTIFVVSPEQNSMQQLIFRENVRDTIEGKKVLLLSANVSTGKTIDHVARVVNYYGGQMVGIAAVFSRIPERFGMPIYSLFKSEDFPDYQTYLPLECPYCSQGMPIEAMVSSSGYSILH